MNDKPQVSNGMILLLSGTLYGAFCGGVIGFLLGWWLT